MERNESFGKCNFINLENGLKCGCLRYRNNPGISHHLCEGCGHDQTFHEYNNDHQSPSYLSINSELNNIFKKRKVQYDIPSDHLEFNVNSTTQNKFNPYHNIQRNPINNKHNIQKSFFFTLIILPSGNKTPKIPRK